MNKKKIGWCFLFLSFQTFCMVKTDSKEITRLADISEKIIPLHWKKSDESNKQFCFNSNRYDIPTITIMSELDYKSNIQFISTCKYLYKEYGHGENSKFLFTHYVNSVDYKRVINCFDNTQNFYETIEKDNILREHIMILAANPICLQYFLKQGLSPNNKSDDGEPLIYCFIGVESAIPLKILLSDHRTDPNMQNKYGNAALMLAACCNDIEKLNILLADHRVDANMQDKAGNTAIKRANACKNAEAFQILLAHNKSKLSVMPSWFKRTAYPLAKGTQMIRFLSEETFFYGENAPRVIKIGTTATIAMALLLGWNQFSKK